MEKNRYLTRNFFSRFSIIKIRKPSWNYQWFLSDKVAFCNPVPVLPKGNTETNHCGQLQSQHNSQPRCCTKRISLLKENINLDIQGPTNKFMGLVQIKTWGLQFSELKIHINIATLTSQYNRHCVLIVTKCIQVYCH